MAGELLELSKCPSFLQITFKNEVGQYDLEVTTFQLAVLFAWNQRPRERISFENLKLATELPDAELRRTLWVKTHDEDKTAQRMLEMNSWMTVENELF